ncbi:MAG: hypothetical protein OK456_08495 [Thaumarchaeota archaeon]|nr:hypothetical protein [Nitrososphaerota archaeon]
MPEQNGDTRMGEFRTLGAVLATVLLDFREEELFSYCREILDVAFCDSVGSQLINTLLDSGEPMSLRAIAARCNVSKRHIMPEGEVRVVLDRLAQAGLVVKAGNESKPRYLLNSTDRRVQVLWKIYRPLHYETRGPSPVSGPRKARGSPS